jgi:Lon protease-like protein
MLNDANPTPYNEQIVEDKIYISEELLILPLTNQVAFPTLNMTLAIQTEATPMIEKAMKGDRIIGAVGIRNLMVNP